MYYTRQIYYKQISSQFRFRNMFQKPTVLNIIFWEKCLWCSNILIKLRSWREAVISPKTEFMLSLSKEALKILMYLQKNFLGGRFYFLSLQFYQNGFCHRNILAIVLQDSSFWRHLCHFFSNKVPDLYLQVATLWKMTFTKYIV